MSAKLQTLLGKGTEFVPSKGFNVDQTGQNSILNKNAYWK